MRMCKGRGRYVGRGVGGGRTWRWVSGVGMLAREGGRVGGVGGVDW